MGGGVDPQDGLFDKTFSDDGLEGALEEREQLRQTRLAAVKAFVQADKAVKTQLASYELAVGEVARIGRFRIKKTLAAGREVSFETSPSERLNIKVRDGA